MSNKSRQTANLVSDNNIFVDIVNDRVGIGTTNPTSKLQVQGDVNVSGVVTASSFSGNATSATYSTSSGISTYSETAGVSTSVIGGIGSITQLQVSGISTFTNGPVLVGSASSTGTASQTLQVTGGGYVSGNIGIGTTNPTSKLQVQGDVNVSGALTATGAINSSTDVQINGVSVLTSASNDAVALAIALG